MRTFQIILINKEQIKEKYSIKIKDSETPKIAAKQLVNKYPNIISEIYIKEKTKDSKKKIYGPYIFINK